MLEQEQPHHQSEYSIDREALMAQGWKDVEMLGFPVSLDILRKAISEITTKVFNYGKPMPWRMFIAETGGTQILVSPEMTEELKKWFSFLLPAEPKPLRPEPVVPTKELAVRKPKAKQKKEREPGFALKRSRIGTELYALYGKLGKQYGEEQIAEYFKLYSLTSPWDVFKDWVQGKRMLSEKVEKEIMGFLSRFSLKALQDKPVQPFGPEDLTYSGSKAFPRPKPKGSEPKK